MKSVTLCGALGATLLVLVLLLSNDKVTLKAVLKDGSQITVDVSPSR